MTYLYGFTGHLWCYRNPWVRGVGMGVGWTLPTCAIPVCHPSYHRVANIKYSRAAGSKYNVAAT